MKKYSIGMLLCSLLIVSLFACSPQEQSSGQKNIGDRVAVAWSADAECTTCHNSFSATTGTAAFAHESNGFDCYTCHSKQEMLEVHEKNGNSGRTPTGLRFSSVTNEACMNSVCHPNSEDFVAATENVVLTDEKGTSENPHAVLSRGEHKDILCADCHTMHEVSNPAEVSEATCFGCHHEKVFECGTCHN